MVSGERLANQQWKHKRRLGTDLKYGGLGISECSDGVYYSAGVTARCSLAVFPPKGGEGAKWSLRVSRTFSYINDVGLSNLATFRKSSSRNAYRVLRVFFFKSPGEGQGPFFLGGGVRGRHVRFFSDFFTLNLCMVAPAG